MDVTLVSCSCRGLRTALRQSTALCTAALSLGLCLTVAVPALANPDGAKVVHGKVKITQGPAGVLQIDQTSKKAIINWRGFNIDFGEETRFVQPGTKSVTLNRVVGNDRSIIAGKLTANGQVVLLNPNGITFTKTAKVDMAGLVASTSHMNDSDFLADRYRFEPGARPGASVVNEGDITIHDGGLAAFVSPWVQNSGTINAQLGRVALASGEAFTLDLNGDGLITLDVRDNPAIKGIEQAGSISAEGGTVALTVADASAVVDRIVNMSGVIEARHVANVGGRIVLSGGSDAILTQSGRLDASGRGAGDTGGEVTLATGRIALAPTAVIDVSGAAGGGEARIGAGPHGIPPVPLAKPAQEVEVAEGAMIKADATESDNGGTIVAWGTDKLVFAGSASARGGPAGGKGGFVETSSKGLLEVSGAHVDAPGGEWLLDPGDVLVSDDPDDVSTPTLTVIRPSEIVDGLEKDLSFTVDTSNVPARRAPGAIEVASDIVTTGSSAATLTFVADFELHARQGCFDPRWRPTGHRQVPR